MRFTEEEIVKRRAYDRTYYLKNREKINKQCREYGAKHREKLNAYSREYKRENREKIKALNRAYYLKHRERIIAASLARYYKRKQSHMPDADFADVHRPGYFGPKHTKMPHRRGQRLP